MAEWAGILATTIPLYLREVEDQTLRNRKWLAALKSKNRISYNNSGYAFEWPVEFKEAIPQGYGDMGAVTFQRRNRHKRAVLDWRAYVLGEATSHMDTLKNKGTEAIVNVESQRAQLMIKNFEHFFSEQLYIDGNAAGNAEKIHGIESFMGAGSVITSTPVAAPSDSYAGIDTTLQTYGGTWNNAASVAASLWPTGSGTAEYDFWSPLLISYTNSYWTGTTTWPNTCELALRYGILHSQRNKGPSGPINMVMLNSELYRQFADKQAGKERIVINQGGGSGASGLTKLGFGDVINFEGCDVTTEFGVPAGVGYGFNINEMELRGQEGQLFTSVGPIFNEEDQTYRYLVRFHGNLQFGSPRNFVKWAAYG